MRAKGVSMNLVIIPPGGAVAPHLHRGCETAIYLFKGRVETLYGPGMREAIVNEECDFIFKPANVPHQSVSLSDSETARAIVASNYPNVQESAIRYDPESAR